MLPCYFYRPLFNVIFKLLLQCLFNIDQPRRSSFLTFSISISTTTASTNEDVLFECGSHTGSERTYNWTFNDGETESLYENPSVTHQFALPGVYAVSLLVYNKISSATFEVRGLG